MIILFISGLSSAFTLTQFTPRVKLGTVVEPDCLVVFWGASSSWFSQCAASPCRIRVGTGFLFKPRPVYKVCGETLSNEPHPYVLAFSLSTSGKKPDPLRTFFCAEPARDRSQEIASSRAERKTSRVCLTAEQEVQRPKGVHPFAVMTSITKFDSSGITRTRFQPG